MMSRSKRKTPIHGVTLSNSDKDYKRKANRRLRAANKAIVRRDGAESELVLVRNVARTWGMAKDGKRYFDAAKYPHMMRK